jgi:diguanylate cyclase (GGDEF)-like protein
LSTTRLSAALPSLAGAAAVALLVTDEFTRDHGWLPIPVAVIALSIFLRFSLVSRDNHRLIEHNRREAVTDPLTGLANRRALLEDLSVAHPCARALVLFDLDGFKLYNDTFGHPAGDVLLQMIGGALATAVGPRGRAYRLGGDEFCALLEGEGSPEAAGLRLATVMSREGHGFRVGASFGATAIPAGAPAPARTLPEADQRLYDNKHARRVSTEDQAALSRA